MTSLCLQTGHHCDSRDYLRDVTLRPSVFRLVTSIARVVTRVTSLCFQTGHQDEPRLNESQNAEALLVLKLTLPGSSVLYYGEEIGMSNIDTTSSCRDPAGQPGNITQDAQVRGYTLPRPCCRLAADR